MNALWMLNLKLYKKTTGVKNGQGLGLQHGTYTLSHNFLPPNVNGHPFIYKITSLLIFIKNKIENAIIRAITQQLR